ncbi:SdpI family protein [Rhodococcus sp. KBS0724]|uniref:SdpI family protein n=1 Tax=Rhodococcus sp. KBS0724 TaxID=1179674 RepID=UPI00110D779A|nr:SdpI family protein [Rhodococcus sp. KBS0724]TSD49072.1 SdpI family protein [Rhodococcus sp. KBS0724]
MSQSRDLIGLVLGLSIGTVMLVAVTSLIVRFPGDEPNSVMGIRTKATMSSPEAWQRSHQAARPGLRRATWVALAGIAVQVVVGSTVGVGTAASAAVAVVVFAAVTALILAAALTGNKVAREIQCRN